MKHLIYLLVVVNLVYFSWHTLRGETDNDTVHALPPLPPDTRRLMTLQELKDREGDPRPAGITETQPSSQAESPADVVTVAEIGALTALQPPAAAVPLSCYTVGPFLAEAELEQAAARLDALELESSQRSAEARHQIGWWIYIPAMPRKEALRFKAQLDKHKDKEYYIGRENVLSLGAFKSKARADRRMKQLHKIGIKEAVLEARYKTRNEYWLDLLEGISAADHDRLSSELSGTNIEEQACR